MTGPFTVDDLNLLSEQVQRDWRAAAKLDWDVAAGRLDWTCRETAAHVVDTMFAPAFFLASRRTHDYPNFGRLEPSAGTTIVDLSDGLRAATNLLVGAIETAPPATLAIIRRFPEVETAPPSDFAPRGALELVVHSFDIAAGLGIDFDLDEAVAERLRDHTAGWPIPWQPSDYQPTGDAAADILARFGR